MEPSLQRRIQRYGWDKAATLYENAWQLQLKPAQDKLLEMADLGEGDKVLDIACGTGLVSFAAAVKVGKSGFVLGTDISEKMVEVSRICAIENEYMNTKFERMDAEDLEVENESFDAVLCALGLMYVPDPVKAMKESYRALKPGGRAVAAVWGQRKECGWAQIFEIVDKRVHSEVCPMFFHLGNPDVLKRTFEIAGFSRCETARINTTLHYNSDEEACVAAFAGGPVALAYHKFTQEVKASARLEYLDSISAYRNQHGYAIPGEFVVVKGYR
jgi:ubiquinone/menaquinone biosynthesis C-methylase UbiE